MADLSRWLARHTAQAFRHHAHTLSDRDLKDIKELVDPKELARAFMEMGGPHDGFEWQVMHNNCDEPFGYDFNNAHQWRDDVIDKYAEHIKNYYYNYKPEAQAIDPAIDPSEQQLGPMAQDIEQVNPAAVKETPEGVKEVDTGKLALMNAGAIADLARRMDKISEMQSGGSSPVPSVPSPDEEPPLRTSPSPRNHQAGGERGHTKSIALSALGGW
jgi:hypothetical protein